MRVGELGRTIAYEATALRLFLLALMDEVAPYRTKATTGDKDQVRAAALRKNFSAAVKMCDDLGQLISRKHGVSWPTADPK